MSRARSDSHTGELFSVIPTAAPLAQGSMDFRRPVAGLVSQMLKAAPDSRYVVAARMSELADHETSKAILDSYTAESREECNLPLWKAPLIEAATGSRVLAEWHAATLGGRVLWGAEIIDADIGRRERLIGDLQAEVKALRKHRRGAR